MKFFLIHFFLFFCNLLSAQFSFQQVDINREVSNISNPSGFLELNGKMFFTADNGINGIEPWISDGTETGTFMLKDINKGIASSEISQFKFVFQNKFKQNGCRTK